MKIFKEIVGGSVMASLLVFSGFVALEAQIVGASDGVNVNSPDTDVVIVTQVVEAGITISDGANVTMSRSLAFTGADTATGEASWTVATNAQAGYMLEVDAADPACAGDNVMCDAATGESFTDDASVIGAPAPWAVSNSYEFGFSARSSEGTVNAGVWGTDTTPDCVGATANDFSTELNYVGFTTGTDIQIAGSATATVLAGETTFICLATEQQGTALAPVGTYIATITATATSL